jgi:hypothetical protein
MNTETAAKLPNYTLSIDGYLYLKYTDVHRSLPIQERKSKMNIDQNRMQQVVQEAFEKVSASRRWQTAIAKAKEQIEENPYMHFDNGTLLLLSPSGEIYSANGTCQCKAYIKGQPCWHRAAARLVERYMQTLH